MPTRGPTFLSAADPLCEASKAPFLTLRVATPSGAPREAPLEESAATRRGHTF